MKKSRRSKLPEYDYDERLVDAQMEHKFVEGIGFSGYRKDAIIDPADILKTHPRQIADSVRQEHEDALRRKTNTG